MYDRSTSVLNLVARLLYPDIMVLNLVCVHLLNLVWEPSLPCMRGHDDQDSEEDSQEGCRSGVEIVNFLCYSCIRMSMVFIILMHTYIPST